MEGPRCKGIRSYVIKLLHCSGAGNGGGGTFGYLMVVYGFFFVRQYVISTRSSHDR